MRALCGRHEHCHWVRHSGLLPGRELELPRSGRADSHGGAAAEQLYISWVTDLGMPTCQIDIAGMVLNMSAGCRLMEGLSGLIRRVERT